MHRPDGFFKTIAPDNNGNGEFARSLRDGNDIDALARDCREDSSGESRCASHAFADNGKQADIVIHINRAQIAVRQFERERGFQACSAARSSSLRTRKQKLCRKLELDNASASTLALASASSARPMTCDPMSDAVDG